MTASTPTEDRQVPLHTKIVLSTITVVYFFLTVTYLAPDSEFKKRVIEPVKQMWLFWGLDQNWSLFSPVIRDINYHTTAVITFADGTQTIWELPRMSKLSLLERFKLEKFRKWDIDSLPWPDFKEFQPDFARYVGRKYYTAENPPVSLALNLHWVDIPKPADDKIIERENLPEHTKFNNVFVYKYQPQDFK